MINSLKKISVNKLTQEQITNGLSTLKNWNIIDDSLVKHIKFKNFEQTWGFLNQVSLRSHLYGHHPTILTTYNKVSITLTTHDLKGISDIDLKFAKRIDGYVEDYKSMD